MMSSQSRRVAGILLVVLPTVIFGGVSILSLLISPHSGYLNNPLRQNLWRAGHAHAEDYLILSLVVLRYVDEAVLSDGLKHSGFAPIKRLLSPVNRWRWMEGGWRNDWTRGTDTGRDKEDGISSIQTVEAGRTG